MSLVLGVDPGLATGGWALLDLGLPPKRQLQAHGRLTSSPSDGTEDERREVMLGQVKASVRRAELVAIEDQYATAGGVGRSAMQVARVAACIADYARAQDKSVVWVYPAQAKAALVGQGNATKEQMIAWARQRFGASLSEHEADAVGIALAGADAGAETRVPTRGAGRKRNAGAQRDPLAGMPEGVRAAAERARGAGQ